MTSFVKKNLVTDNCYEGKVTGFKYFFYANGSPTPVLDDDVRSFELDDGFSKVTVGSKAKEVVNKVKDLVLKKEVIIITEEMRKKELEELSVFDVKSKARQLNSELALKNIQFNVLRSNGISKEGLIKSIIIAEKMLKG